MTNLEKEIQEATRDSASIRKAICKGVGISEGEYCQMQYDEGVAYLGRYLMISPEAQDILARSRIFWNWWRNHWEIRDIGFLAALDRCLHSPQYVRSTYERLNNGVAITQRIHPGSAILDETFSEMVHKISLNATA